MGHGQNRQTIFLYLIFKCFLSLTVYQVQIKESGSRCYIPDRLLEKLSLDLEAVSRFFGSGIHTISVAAVKAPYILYCSLYVSPRPAFSLILEASNFISKSNCRDVVIAGDYNVDFNVESSLSNNILSFMNDNGFQIALPPKVTSTTKLKTKIDNLFVNREVRSAGTYVSFTSYPEPLWLLI
ncbi:hypothetical protein EDC96DRAFT_591288 [Choanephora cucurbitarum]|nr:hypothetical protein EDC96DRAFT_591288 [Choanephora cucurbitarum]